MAFTTLASALIEVGKPVIKQIFTILKGNDDDLNSRLTLIEGSVNKIEVFNGTFHNAVSASSFTGLIFWEAPSDFTLTAAQVSIFDISGKSFSGNLEMDIQKASGYDFSSSVSVFTTRPSLNLGTASSYDKSTNAVFDTNNDDISAGDVLRLDISSLPSGDTLTLFNFRLIGEAS